MPDAGDVRSKFTRLGAIVAAIIFLGVAGLIGGTHYFRARPAPDAVETATAATPWPANGPSLGPPDLDRNPDQVWIDPPSAVAEAFELAFRGDDPQKVKIEGLDYQFSPARIADTQGLISVDDRRVLVSIGWQTGAAHAVSGYVTIHYFKAGTPLSLIGGWRVPEGAWGMPPKIVLDEALLPYPTVKLMGGANGQGCGDEAPVMVELRPDGPVFGTVVEASGTIEGPHPYTLESKMTRANGGFDIQYRGADSRMLRYRRANGKFVTRDRTAGLPTCGEYENVVEHLK